MNGPRMVHLSEKDATTRNEAPPTRYTLKSALSAGVVGLRSREMQSDLRDGEVLRLQAVIAH